MWHWALAVRSDWGDLWIGAYWVGMYAHPVFGPCQFFFSFTWHRSHRMLDEHHRIPIRQVFHSSHDAPNSFCHNSQRWAWFRRRIRWNAFSVSPCCHRIDQCFDSSIGLCIHYPGTRRIAQIVNSLWPPSARSSRPNCLGCVENHRLGTYSW